MCILMYVCVYTLSVSEFVRNFNEGRQRESGGSEGGKVCVEGVCVVGASVGPAHHSVCQLHLYIDIDI